MRSSQSRASFIPKDTTRIKDIENRIKEMEFKQNHMKSEMKSMRIKDVKDKIKILFDSLESRSSLSDFKKQKLRLGKPQFIWSLDEQVELVETLAREIKFMRALGNKTHSKEGADSGSGASTRNLLLLTFLRRSSSSPKSDQANGQQINPNRVKIRLRQQKHQRRCQSNRHPRRIKWKRRKHVRHKPKPSGKSCHWRNDGRDPLANHQPRRSQKKYYR